MREAIVIGCHVSGYGAIRALALQRFRIVAMCYDETMEFAQDSRHVAERVRIPNPRTHEQQFVDFLVQNAARWPQALILETNDDVAMAISKSRHRLEGLLRFLTPPWDVLRTIIEKPKTYQLARDCDVPIPKTTGVSSVEELRSIENDLSFPCILKPVVGHLFFGEFGVKSFVCENFDELTNAMARCAPSGHRMMVQEIIPGPDSNIYQCLVYIDRSGRTRANFITRKLRQNPPGFGVARAAVSHAPMPELVEHTERMLRRIGFTGIACSEFKQDPRDGLFKLIEINARLPRSNWLSAYCGVNFPWLAYQDLCGAKTIETGGDYPKDVYWIEASKDLTNTLRHRREENLRMSDYLAPYLAKRKTYADFAVRDLRPLWTRLRIAAKSIVTDSSGRR